MLENNRKFKLTLCLIILAVMLFAVPETWTSFSNLHAEREVAALVLEEGQERPVAVKLNWHLLNAGTFATLLGTLITVYFGANVAQKVWVEPPVALGQPVNGSARRKPDEIPEVE